MPASYEVRRILEESLEQLPNSIKQVYFRTDGAGYQEEVLRFCAEGRSARFGVIEFAISAKVSEGFKKAVLEVEEDKWQSYVTVDEFGNEVVHANQEWAEVVYVPEWSSHKKRNPDYRFIATREYLGEVLTGEKKELRVPTIEVNQKRYKVFGIVSNRLKMDGSELIAWHRQRCGKSEDVHKEEKFDLSCKLMPSNLFGANMAFWLIMVLSYNLAHLMQEFNRYMDVEKHMDSVRREYIQIAGRVVSQGRYLRIKLDHNEECLYRILVETRQ